MDEALRRSALPQLIIVCKPLRKYEHGPRNIAIPHHGADPSKLSFPVLVTLF